MRTRRAFIATVVTLAAASSACGTTEAPAGPAPEASGPPVSVVDSRGKEVRLEHPAARVAATEWNAAEYLVSLGVMPAAVSDVRGYGEYSSAAPLDASVADIGTRGEPSIDALGSLDLDLVVVTGDLPEGALEQIEAKVPVVVIPGGNAQDPIGSMFSNVDLIAQATGTQDAAARLKSEFDAKVQAGRAAVRQAGMSGRPVAFADAYATAGSVTIRPYTRGSLVGAVFERIGLPTAWEMEGDPAYGLAQTDVEGLTKLGDVPFWYNATSGDPFAENLAGNPIWTNLPFVQKGEVHLLPGELWTFGGPKSMERFVDAAIAAVQA
ncbi:iron-siderophore ABC transporter substrate-binding protein [Saccharopolyspora dendranthemae]|uniref:Iron complex transport system substrate-binding protein n=1 Tax=Saccharopolyspora dendranthemae TaxID=1181886 RepID=A0A561U1V0_9PSEU|nr:iron-siderophore ABC transporter substrate-binding protein [Saccharopolyspora dendranthemae]TWF93332.1 iron complex transport system substrate-binding protein [Saccharopolyspora dendranthemae]